MTNSATLIVALDFPLTEPALSLARKLCGLVSWVKIGLELYLAAGSKLIAQLKEMGFKVFLDLKFMDIPNTVQAAVAQGTVMGADMLTIHVLGGEKMCRAAVLGRDQALATGQGLPLIFGVTVLTSLGLEDLIWNPHGSLSELEQLTTSLAHSAQRWDLDGVVCSGAEISAIRQACGVKFGILTPGIRLPGADVGDQARICTPGQAVLAGSNFLVVGRPITRAVDPAYMAQKYIQAMEQSFVGKI